MPKLSQVREITVKVPCVLDKAGNVVVNLEIYPTRFNAKFQREAKEKSAAALAAAQSGAEVNDEDLEVSAQTLKELLAGWDLTDDEGEFCPITIKFLSEELGYMVINQMIAAALKGTNPNA